MQRQVIAKQISNVEFHDLGTEKIQSGVGEGLAEAMADLKQLRN
ncbi:MAG: hypothetical protein NT013_02980 [Planctomycetia bacterium]|nr:hypothetical protein [Planctomycetia bacterium]